MDGGHGSAANGVKRAWMAALDYRVLLDRLRDGVPTGQAEGATPVQRLNARENALASE